jgi:hypothetical protein
MRSMSKLLLTAVLTLAACDNGSPGSGSADAPMQPGVDAPVGSGARLPTWMLEDVQPLSPRVGQTYGLDGFGNKVVVAVLLEGF